MIRKQFETAMVGILIFASIGYSNSETNQKTPPPRDCAKIYRILGASFVAGSVVAAGLSYLDPSGRSVREANEKKRKIEIPKSADIKLKDIPSEKELYSRSSELADFLLDKHSEDPKFSASLKQFIERNPSEAIAALSVRHGLSPQNPQRAKALFTELGSKTHYALTFAWIISKVYNEKEKAPEKTLHNIIADIEKSIDSIDYYTR